jgi:hypothetical protein
MSVKNFLVSELPASSAVYQIFENVTKAHEEIARTSLTYLICTARIETGTSGTDNPLSTEIVNLDDSKPNRTDMTHQ